MGLQSRPWQDMDYILRYFGRAEQSARKAYFAYVEEGIARGRREDLTGGGLIRSLDGWSEVKLHRGKTSNHTMSDERILGDGPFVDSVIDQAAETFDRRYELKRQGYDLDRIAGHVANILNIKEGDIFKKGNKPLKVKARSMLCYWAVREAGTEFPSGHWRND
jgi:hypothetical protein